MSRKAKAKAASRGKQPARGARRPQPAKRKTTAKPRLTVEPLELRIELEGIQRNEKGEIVGKAIMATGTILPSDFSTLPEQLKDAIEQHQEAAAQTEEG